MVENALTEDLQYLVTGWQPGEENEMCERLIGVGLLSSQSQVIMAQSSKPPTISVEGKCLR